jgi:hypothetical protein
LEHHDRIGFCALDQWEALDAEFFKRLTALLRHTTSPLKPLAPRPHQRCAIRRLPPRLRKKVKTGYIMRDIG